MTSQKWPCRGDKAFPPAVPALDSSILPAFWWQSSGGYTVAFKSAAEKVVEGARHESRNPDLLFAPLAYLYRHYLELELKGIVRLGVRLGIITVNDDRLEDHNLHKLWNSTRRVIESIWPTGDRADTNAVQQVVLEFHRLDPTGQGLRYASDKEGKPHLTNAPVCVSLEHLKTTMDAVADYLEAAEAGIDACDRGPP